MPSLCSLRVLHLCPCLDGNWNIHTAPKSMPGRKAGSKRKAGVQKGHDQHPSERRRVSRAACINMHIHIRPAKCATSTSAGTKNWCHHPITELVQASHQTCWWSWLIIMGCFHQSKPSDSGAKIIISSSCSSCALREPQQNTSTMRTSRTKVRKKQKNNSHVAWTARKDWIEEAHGRPGKILGAHLSNDDKFGALGCSRIQLEAYPRFMFRHTANTLWVFNPQKPCEVAKKHSCN